MAASSIAALTSAASNEGAPIVRLCVRGNGIQTDVGLPAQVPVAALIGPLMTRLKVRADVEEYHRWTLAPIAGDPLPTSVTLLDAGVLDGDMLLLIEVPTIAPTPVFDDVTDAIAESARTRQPSWSASAARGLSYGVALVAAVLAGATLVGGYASRPSSGSAVDAGADPLTASAPIIAALLAAVGFGIAARLVHCHRSDAATAAWLGGCAVVVAGAAGAAALAPHWPAAMVAGGASAGLTAFVAQRYAGVGTTAGSAVVTGAVGLAATGLLAVAIDSTLRAAAVLAAGGLVIVLCGPRLAAVLAKLPLPPVPTAGEPLDPVEDVPPAIDGLGAVGAMQLPSWRTLSARSAAANAHLTGITCAGAVLAGVGAVAAAGPWRGFDGWSVAYAAVICAVVMLRGRSHTDLVQACVLIASGAVAGLAVVFMLGASSWTAGSPESFVIAAILLSSAAGAVVIGVVAAGRRFSPIARRAAEVCEYLLIALVTPLLLQLCDLYQLVRSLK